MVEQNSTFNNFCNFNEFYLLLEYTFEMHFAAFDYLIQITFEFMYRQTQASLNHNYYGTLLGPSLENVAKSRFDTFLFLRSRNIKLFHGIFYIQYYWLSIQTLWNKCFIYTKCLNIVFINLNETKYGRRKFITFFLSHTTVIISTKDKMWLQCVRLIK